jgi:hypothetical protein
VNHIDYMNARRERKPASGGKDYTVYCKQSDFMPVTRLRCTGCGAEVNSGCDCGVAYESLAAKREQQRQASKAYRERKAEMKERLRQLAPSEARMTGAALRELRSERREKAEEKQQPHHMTYGGWDSPDAGVKDAEILEEVPPDILEGVPKKDCHEPNILGWGPPQEPQARAELWAINIYKALQVEMEELEIEALVGFRELANLILAELESQ